MDGWDFLFHIYVDVCLVNGDGIIIPEKGPKAFPLFSYLLFVTQKKRIFSVCLCAKLVHSSLYALCLTECTTAKTRTTAAAAAASTTVKT